MPRPIHFEIHAAEPARAIAFYEKVFGWSFKKWDGGTWEYWVISTGPADAPGIDGGLIKRMGPAPASGQPVNAFVCTLGVDALAGDLVEVLRQLSRLLVALADVVDDLPCRCPGA